MGEDGSAVGEDGSAVGETDAPWLHAATISTATSPTATTQVILRQ